MTQPPVTPAPPAGEVPPEPVPAEQASAEQVPVEGDMSGGDEWLVQAMASNRFEIKEPSPLQQMNPYETNVAPAAPQPAGVPGAAAPGTAAPPAVPPQAPGG